MQVQSDVEYHQERARKELDLGLIAQSTSVARAHLTLASMHLEEARKSAGWAPTSPLPRLRY